MFYSQLILAKKGPLGKIWLAAHWDKKLSKAQIFHTEIAESVDSIVNPVVPLALRVSGHLLLGLVRIYSRKVRYLMTDCSEALVKIKLAFRPGVVDLPQDSAQASAASINVQGWGDFDAPAGDASFSLSSGKLPAIDDWMEAAQNTIARNADITIEGGGEGAAAFLSPRRAAGGEEEDEEEWVAFDPTAGASASVVSDIEGIRAGDRTRSSFGGASVASFGGADAPVFDDSAFAEDFAPEYPVEEGGAMMPSFGDSFGAASSAAGASPGRLSFGGGAAGSPLAAGSPGDGISVAMDETPVATAKSAAKRKRGKQSGVVVDDLSQRVLPLTDLSSIVKSRERPARRVRREAEITSAAQAEALLREVPLQGLHPRLQALVDTAFSLPPNTVSAASHKKRKRPAQADEVEMRRDEDRSRLSASGLSLADVDVSGGAGFQEDFAPEYDDDMPSFTSFNDGGGAPSEYGAFDLPSVGDFSDVNVSVGGGGGGGGGAVSSGVSAGQWHQNTVTVMRHLRRQLAEAEEVAYTDLVPENCNRRTAAGAFFEMLQLKTWDYIDVAQAEPYGEIALRKTERFSEAIPAADLPAMVPAVM